MRSLTPRRRRRAPRRALPAPSTPAVAALLGLLALAVASPAAAKLDRDEPLDNQVLVRAPAETVARLAEKHGLTVLAGDQADGYLAVLAGPPGLTADSIAKLIRHEKHVESVSPASLASVPDVDGLLFASTADVAGDLLRADPFSSPCLGSGFAEELWGGYGDQEAADLVRLHQAHLESADCGAGVVVAVLDTGIDPTHPLFAGALAEGADFLSDTVAPGIPSEWSNVDQSVRAIVEQSVRAIVEQSQVAVLGGGGHLADEGSMAPILAGGGGLSDLPLPAAFGHGTMVAGLVRWIAPGARIMPLRVFDGDGSGHVFDIVRAVYWAVDHGADVINMSFSSPVFDLELLRAVEYAKAHGVVTIAAAGNRGERDQAFPASLAAVIGVASSDDDDRLSAFSNWGAELADLAAPGSGLVTAYPGGLFAAGWGTSFAAPLVSGTAALVQPRFAGGSVGDYRKQVRALLKGSAHLDDLCGQVASGRLDVLGALREAH